MSECTSRISILSAEHQETECQNWTTTSPSGALSCPLTFLNRTSPSLLTADISDPQLRLGFSLAFAHMACYPARIVARVRLHAICVYSNGEVPDGLDISVTGVGLN